MSVSLPFLPDRIDHWPLARLLPYAQNARIHSDHQVGCIAGSMATHGWTVPILATSDGEVIAGHGRLLAAQKLGLDSAPVIVADHLTEAQRRAYRIADNKLTEIADWDEATLAREIEAISHVGVDIPSLGFDDAEIDRLLADVTGEGEGARDTSATAGADDGDGSADGTDEDAGGEGIADDAPAPEDATADAEPPVDPVTRPGDLWLLGEHRLLCGDSTDGASVARLMENERAALLFTSPPYGQQRDYATGGIADWDGLMNGVFAAAECALAPSAQVLVNLGMVHRAGEWQPYWQNWLTWMRTQGWRRFGLYVWDQGPALPGDWNGRLAPSFELVFHFNREVRRPNKIVPCKHAGHVNDAHGGMRSKDGTVGAWYHAGQGVQDMRIPDNVLRITRHKHRGIETDHPAVFPVKLPAFVMEAYADDGEVIFEPFAGAGTSILAGARAMRRVRALEIAPEYVDLAIARWRKAYPDAPVTLAEDGRTYDEIAEERGVEVPYADAA